MADKFFRTHACRPTPKRPAQPSQLVLLTVISEEMMRGAAYRLALRGRYHVCYPSRKAVVAAPPSPLRASTTAAVRFLSASSSSQTDRTEDPPTSRLYPVYVHQVSKTVLQHLQDQRSEWLITNGLDRGLHFNANGTFVLKFPASRLGVDAGRIWTSYDSASQQHWLSIYRQKLMARFLLKDASKSPRNTHYRFVVSTKTEQEIRSAVDKMIEALEGRG